MKIASDLMPHRARGCPFRTNVDGEDFFVFGVLLEGPFVHWGIRIVAAVLFFRSLFFCIVIGKNYGIEHSVFIACIVLLFPGLFLFCSDLFHYVKRKKCLDGQQV